MKLNFKRKVLKNGMTILFEKRDIPIVSVAFAVRSGSINELISEKGISHFVEHLVYKGTTSRNHKQIVEEIERKGGDLNGFTSESTTAFWCKMPSKHLNIALDVLSDLIKNPLFEEKKLESERKVIFEEIKMYRDSPRYHSLLEAEKNLFSGIKSLSTIGTVETLSKIDRKKVLAYFEKVYKPNNTVMVVVGNADFDELVKFAENNFGNEKGSVLKPKIVKKNASSIEKRKGIDQANVVFAYHVPLSTNDKSYAARVLSTLMAEGMSSRLFLEIREKRNLAYAIRGDSEITKDYAYNSIYVGTTKENVEKVKKLILEGFDDVTKNLTEKELQAIKEQMIGAYQISMEDSQNQMANLLFAEIDGDVKDYYNFEKKVSKVNLKDVRDLAKIKKYSFFALIPAKA